MEAKVQKSQKVIDELKNLLQITVKSDQKKDALLQETKVAFQAERDKIAARMRNVDVEKNTLDEYKKQIRQENLALVEKIDHLEFTNRELTTKVKSLSDFLVKKESECDGLVRENESNRKSLKQCQFELEQCRDSNEVAQKTFQKDANEMKIENEDLAELLKTKERMLEDQVTQIQ